MTVTGQTKKPLRIGISTHHFLHLPGAIDLLRMIIRGLKHEGIHKLFLLVESMPNDPEHLKTLDDTVHRWSNYIFNKFEKFIPVPFLIKRILCKIERTVRLGINQKVQNVYDYPIVMKTQGLLGKQNISDMEVLAYNGFIKGIYESVKKYDLDVVIPTTFGLPTPFVSYLYDCQHKYFPENFQPNDLVMRDQHFQALIDASPSIIVNSQAVKSDLKKFFNAHPKQITALPFTPQLDPDALIKRSELLKPYRLPSKYFLISNQFWVHKSLETAVKSLRLLIDEGLNDCHIVFTGQMEDTRFPDYVPGFFNYVENLKLSANTSFLGYIPKRDQLEIMKGAVAVIQTTLFEGGPGGGAVYDAVALGVPAIVSDIPINRELPLNDNLVLFKAKDEYDLAMKMRTYLLNPALRPPKNQLIEMDRQRMQRFADSLYDAIQMSTKTWPPPQEDQDKHISVITVTKNAEQTLRATVDSVVQQSYQHIEYIVVDSCSTDKTIDIVRDYGDKIQFASEPDNGIYDAMNKGIDMATGNVLYFLNAGDTLYDENVFMDVMRYINDPEFAEIGLFYGDVQFMKTDGTEGRKLEYNSFPFFFYADNCQCHQVCFYRQELFQELGKYDTEFKVYGDQEFNARVVVKHEIQSLHLNRVIVRYLEGGYSENMLTSSSLNVEEKRKIKQMYFGDTPEWFFERLKCLELA